MSSTWQTWIALGIVAGTAAVMLYRFVLRSKPGCGSDCGCHDAGKDPLRKRDPAKP